MRSDQDLLEFDQAALKERQAANEAQASLIDLTRAVDAADLPAADRALKAVYTARDRHREAQKTMSTVYGRRAKQLDSERFRTLCRADSIRLKVLWALGEQEDRLVTLELEHGVC